MAAGDVTISLLDELGVRLEDPKERKYTEKVKIQALNSAILHACIELTNGYLGELEVVDTSTPMTAFALPLSALASGTPFTGSEGVIMVQNGSTGGRFMTRMKLEDLKKLENSILASGTTNLIYYVYAGSINCKNGGTPTDPIVVYYLKNPATVAIGTDPDINTALLDIVVDLAESLLFAADDDQGRADDALSSAMLQIDFLNAMYIPPFGIGTEGDKRYRNQTA